MATSDKIWQAYFGNRSEAKDAFGITIYRNKYVQDNNNIKEGFWTIDHIFPKNPFNDNSQWKRKGSNSFNNLQPLSVSSNEKKGSFLAGKINGITFSIKIIKDDENGVVGRMMVKIGETWYWAY